MENIKGKRSNFITTNCWGIGTEDWVIKTLDLRNKLDGYIPEYIMKQYDPNIRDNKHNKEWFVNNWPEVLKEMFRH